MPSEYAELVVLRIGEHDPPHLALADVGVAGAEREQTFDLGVLVVGIQVDVQTILLELRVVDRNKADPGIGVITFRNQHLLLILVEHAVPEDFGPEAGERARVVCVDRRSACDPRLPRENISASRGEGIAASNPVRTSTPASASEAIDTSRLYFFDARTGAAIALRSAQLPGN